MSSIIFHPALLQIFPSKVTKPHHLTHTFSHVATYLESFTYALFFGVSAALWGMGCSQCEHSHYFRNCFIPKFKANANAIAKIRIASFSPAADARIGNFDDRHNLTDLEHQKKHAI